MNKISISIIIVHYKVKKELLECLESIYKSKPQVNFEIIVVDNDEQNFIQKDLNIKFPKVKYIKSNKNLGFGAGNNLGAKYALGKYLFFLNPDTIIFNNSINALLSTLKNNNNIGIVSPLVVDEKLKSFKTQNYKEINIKNAVFSFSFLRKFFPKKNIYNDSNLNNWDKKSLLEVEAVPGAALMISNKLFKKINGFDERFFLYFEEYDLSEKVKSIGYKLFINPKSVVSHQVGQSIKHLQKRDGIYRKSRFLYFEKYFGMPKALLIELFLRINKNYLFVSFALLIAIFLRVYNLSNSMVFIGDQGWFYLSARDLLMKGIIPLVGITSSHTWLHQGPLWTYMLSIPLFIFKFNPVSGGYLTAVLGTITVFLIYKIGSELFSTRTGIIAMLLYAVSPLIISFDRMPYHTSPIPLFTLLYFYALFKWVSGKINYFPVLILLIAILYNLELATFILFFPFVLLFIFGLIKNKIWVKKILNKKIIIYSLFAFLIPMLPIIVYDLSNGFKQTIVFFGWTIYKPFSYFIKGFSGNLINNFNILLNFSFVNLQKLLFSSSLFISLLVFILSTVLLVYKTIVDHKINNSRFLLILLLSFSLIGIMINQTPSDAYLPILFPFEIFTLSLFFDFVINTKKFKYIGIFILLTFIVLNGYSSYKNSFGNEFDTRTKAVEKIIFLSNGENYNLIGKGEGSQFKSFTMNYEYLLWWKGHAPSETRKKLKIIISEPASGIKIEKE